MADRGRVVLAPRRGSTTAPLRVQVAGIDKPALTIAGATFQATIGDDVVTIPLSDGSVLLLGGWSQ